MLRCLWVGLDQLRLKSICGMLWTYYLPVCYHNKWEICWSGERMPGSQHGFPLFGLSCCFDYFWRDLYLREDSFLFLGGGALSFLVPSPEQAPYLWSPIVDTSISPVCIAVSFISLLWNPCNYYVLTFLLACLITYLLTYLLASFLTYLLASFLTRLLASFLTCLLTYLITYLLTCMLTCLLICLFTLLTLLTYCMEQSTFWEANRFSASQ